MPTIDQLAPAIAASDSDALVSSQNGIARKVTRAQIIAGLQPELSLSSGVLLGRSSAGAGAPEPIGVGANLLLNAGTISAAATPFVVGALPGGLVPVSGDLIPLSQDGTNVAVSYSQFASGLTGLSGVDASSMTVSVAGKVETLGVFAANAISVAGATMSGPLVLNGMPAAPLQAAPKQYVDNQVATSLPAAGGALAGTLTGTTASFSGALSVGGTLNCTGVLSVGGDIVASNGAFSGSLTAASSVQLGPTSVRGNLSAAGSLSATGSVSGTSLSISGLVNAGGIMASGIIIAQGGATLGGGVLQLSQYSVTSLPASPPGTLAYASNARKPGEPPGAGTGVVVWSGSGNQWLSIMSGTPVQA